MNVLVLVFEAVMALASGLEAGAQLAMGDPVFAIYFLIVAFVFGSAAERGLARWQRERKGWS